ncbi:MAG: MBL fold metallo-hydrolase [Methanospirillum sp.]|uniref:MBL fold metallo-hydrolase n=1 Tax=Methanospirillum sp. TaxID=45200 RepID=UPI002375D136|nr:MBL fold metallo-hydrolase [Methanospirillum sp.]MDD1727938.1 MBL fold metallo-hydrolase [Methanospirillum sp.]
MIIRQFFIPGIAHSSYLIGGVSSCLIVDPTRDVDRYLAAARDEGMHITGILETHLHADFVSGHLDLNEKTGAPIYMPARAQALFPHMPVRDGSVITIEDLRIEVRETPGHTPEHVSYVLIHQSSSESPFAVFCGDTLFVGDVGRPDLFPGKAQELASSLYTSLHDHLMTLPDHCKVYPAHGAGSLCGRKLSAQRESTIGYERISNPILAIKDRETFISTLTTAMPPVPDHFGRCSEINRRGPVLVSALPVPAQLSPGEISRLLEEDTVDLIDLRGYDAFGGFHIPSSWNINIDLNFSTFSGWVLNPDRDLILIGDHQDQHAKAVLMMNRVGLDSIRGYLSGGMQKWAFAGYNSDHVSIISVQELATLISHNPTLQILDVRTADEYAGYHIPGSVNIPWPDLRTRTSELRSAGPVVVICGSGFRSGIACSILKRVGCHDILNVAGGYTGWIAAGLNTATSLTSLKN